MNNVKSQSVELIKEELINNNIATEEQLSELNIDELRTLLDGFFLNDKEKKTKKRAGFTTAPLYKKKLSKNKKNIIKNSRKKNR